MYKSCPVQMDSVFANDRKLKMMDMLDNMKEGYLMPEPTHIPIFTVQLERQLVVI
jgi:hypothetical protein